ncbi:MAG: TonB-dependent receptor, partial [Bryobacterales bacterium]|nr:TonB-dependent receptor [Bryobacterales bacterium]
MELVERIELAYSCLHSVEKRGFAMSQTPTTRTPSLLIKLLLAGALLASALLGQVTTATLYGTVIDPSGAAIPHATVAATNEGTQAVSTATTDSKGEFTLTFLPVGSYTVSAKGANFREERRSHLDLGASQRVLLTFTLQIGSTAESITVVEGAPVLNTVSAEQRENVRTEQVRELPVARRDWTTLLNLGTGVSQGGVGNTFGISLNGLPSAGISVTVDGTDAAGDPEYNTLAMYQGMNFIKAVSTEAIAEVNVVKGVMSAEVANTLSGNINVITRSGTNQLHGSLFANNQTENLNARNQFLTTKAPLVFNQFGGSVGGPIIRNKLFFFGAYEGYRQVARVSVNGFLPTKEFRDRAIAAVPAYKPFLDLVPLPNAAVAPGAIAGFYQNAHANPAHDNHAVSRVDYNISNASRLSLRYTRGRPYQETPRLNTNNPRSFIYITEVGSASFIHAAARWSSETRFGHNNMDMQRKDGIGVFLSIPCLNSLSNSGFGFGGCGEDHNKGGHNQSFEQIFGVTSGRNSLKTGVNLLRRLTYRSRALQERFNYVSVDDFFANIPNSMTFWAGETPIDVNSSQLGFFVQDDFRASRTLILNFGIRYDYSMVPTATDGRLFVRGEPTGFGAYRPADSIYNADRNNFSPRAGFAWTVDNAAKTVIRGGAGMFVSPPALFLVMDSVRNTKTTPYDVTLGRVEGLQLGLRYPNTNAQGYARFNVNPNAPDSGTAISSNYPNPYSLQWNLSVQRQLTSTLALETSYTGTRGLKLPFKREMNLVDRQTGVRPDPRFLQFTYLSPADASSYHAWQTSLRKRLGSGVTFGTHYTWSSLLSYQTGDLAHLGNTTQDRRQDDKGPPPSHMRHAFVSDLLYEVPLMRVTGSTSRGARLLLGGWQVGGIFTANSGLPLFVTQSSAFNGSRPNYVGGSAILGNYRETLQYVNRASFQAVPTVRLSGVPERNGNLGRGALRGPGVVNLDLSLSKNLAVTERH